MAGDKASTKYAQQLQNDIINGECQTVEFKKTETSDHEIAEARFCNFKCW